MNGNTNGNGIKMKWKRYADQNKDRIAIGMVTGNRMGIGIISGEIQMEIKMEVKRRSNSKYNNNRN